MGEASIYSAINRYEMRVPRYRLLSYYFGVLVSGANDDLNLGAGAANPLCCRVDGAKTQRQPAFS